MKVKKKVEQREVVTTKPVDTFVLTLDKDEADVVLAVVGALSLDSEGPVRKVTDKLYSQLRRAGLRGVLSDPNKVGYSGLTLGLLYAESGTSPVIKQSNY